MLNNHLQSIWAVVILGSCTVTYVGLAQNPPARPQPDAVQAGQQPTAASSNRPESQKSEHDRSGVFAAARAPASSPVSKTQPKEGKISGFDFYRDPLNADRPNQSPEEIMQKET